MNRCEFLEAGIVERVPRTRGDEPQFLPWLQDNG
jgi:hypothetical protein